MLWELREKRSENIKTHRNFNNMDGFTSINKFGKVY